MLVFPCIGNLSLKHIYKSDKTVCLCVHPYAQRSVISKYNLLLQCTSCPLLHYTSLLFRHHPTSIVCGHQDEDNSFLRQVSSFHLRTIGGMLPRLSGWCLEFVASRIWEMITVFWQWNWWDDGPGTRDWKESLKGQYHDFGWFVLLDVLVVMCYIFWCWLSGLIAWHETCGISHSVPSHLSYRLKLTIWFQSLGSIRPVPTLYTHTT